jgi:hypothetical protein
LNGSGSDGTWTLSGPITAASATEVTLDKDGSTTISYASTPQPSVTASTNPAESTSNTCGGTASGSGGSADNQPGPQYGTALLIIKRPEADQLQNLASNLIATGLGAAGSTAGPALADILKPLLAQIDNTLAGLTQTAGINHVTIKSAPTEAGSAAPSTAGATPSGSCGTCLVGSWIVTQNTRNGRAAGETGIKMTFTPGGLLTLTYDGSTPYISNQVGVESGGYFTGSLSGSYRLHTPESANGTWSWTFSGTVTSHQPNAAASSYPDRGTLEGKWACQGGTATLQWFQVSQLFKYAISRQ